MFQIITIPNNLQVFLLSIGLCAGSLSTAQGVRIDGVGDPPDPSAILDISSVEKGLLIPRMTEVERDAIPLPAIGLMVFQTDGTPGFYYFDGVQWAPVSASGMLGGHWDISGNDIFNTNPGYVGVGTTTPLKPLHLIGDDETFRIQGQNPWIQFVDPVGNPKGWVWQGPGNDLAMGTNIGGGALAFYSANNKNMDIYSFGGVNIYGNSPSLSIRTPDDTRYGYLGKRDENFEITAHRSLQFGQAKDLVLQTDIVNFSFTEYAGNVGIGHSTPDAKLHIQSTNELLRLQGEGYTYLTFYDGNTYKGFLLSSGNDIALGTSYNNSNGALQFYTANSLRMSILPNGNVGIGTISPTQKLAVNGTIRAKEIVVETGWADYVFDDQYRMMSLYEVEQFISLHRHLPGIPQAQEIEAEGLRLGDMQRRMMEKIEELTLHVIRLQKELDQLKSNE